MALSTAFPLLYSFRRCPYAMRARMALHYAGIKTVLREVVLRHKPQEMLELSAKATVPVLLLDDGTVIDESLDIMHWALSVSDKEGWYAGLNEQQLVKANKLIADNDNEFKANLDHYKYADRFPDLSLQESRAQGEIFLQQLEECLQQHRYLLSNQLSFADIAIFPFVRQFAHVDLTWFEQTQYQHLQQWLAGLLNSSLFIAVMEKHQPWKSGDEECFL